MKRRTATAPDADAQLIRALSGEARAADCPITIQRSECRQWASALFIGAQHLLEISAPTSPAFEAWLQALPEAEFRLRGHVLADITVEAVRREGDATEALLLALTVEEA